MYKYYFLSATEYIVSIRSPKVTMVMMIICPGGHDGQGYASEKMGAQTDGQTCSQNEVQQHARSQGIALRIKSRCAPSLTNVCVCVCVCVFLCVYVFLCSQVCSVCVLLRLASERQRVHVRLLVWLVIGEKAMRPSVSPSANRP